MNTIIQTISANFMDGEASSTSSSSSSGVGGIFSGNIFIWIFLGALILILALFMLYTWIKDRRNKKKLLEEKARFEEEAKITFADTLIKVDALVKLNRYELDNFVPSIGSFKMSQLLNASHSVLENILSDTKVQTYLNKNDDYNRFIAVLVNLKDNRSNLWEKKNIQDINYITTQLKMLDTENIEQRSKEEMQKLREFYDYKNNSVSEEA